MFSEVLTDSGSFRYNHNAEKQVNLKSLAYLSENIRFKINSRSVYNAVERIIGNIDGHSRLFGNKLVYPPKQRTAAC